MTKLQYAVITVAVLLLLVLRFGCETKAPKMKGLEKSRSLLAQNTDINVLLPAAKDSLAANDLALVEALEEEFARQTTDTAKVTVLKRLAGEWYSLNNAVISGHYAQQIAELLNTEESWSIAGTTFALALQRLSDPVVREFAASRATKAFENAISINPDELAHKINLALVYTDNPPQDNPMKGILMLRELNDSNPDNPAILLQLGRLAMRTNQLERAVERLERAFQLDPSLIEAACMLAEAYAGLGNKEKSDSFAQKCEQ
ncbi:tetratricopeptide repeat protein [Haliscomenobacter hydrossis]|uniref:Tetratricopeptide TPR_2 repeat-containing protein n=1 Tax=Haliscomenobacter hydrossis (strain ATCC 27775 / DSM 1100 / LMG 10767 / O) TaxID=760192 RepID=F4KZM7_HALH1|nr:tetratricopeptide repeat protein [Haliscomenobacter hydrossis]AEE50463.1 Tetratricopeptide TPR_2 repeat-containing protein [Haliscomenobacter hydrossis DSM 1100]